jgi:AcrR family transcriptional regulator
MRTKDPRKVEQIRTQALAVIAKQGVDGFSMQDLASAAGVSPATLYIHFRDRDDLIYQLWKEQADALAAIVLVGFSPSLPFEDGLRIQWRNRIRFCRENPTGWSFLEQIRHSPYHKSFASRNPSPFFESMGNFVRHAIEAGQLTTFGLRPDQLEAFPRPLYWSLAFAPLYELLRFEAGHGESFLRGQKRPFKLDERCFEQALRCVLRSLQP